MYTHRASGEVAIKCWRIRTFPLRWRCWSTRDAFFPTFLVHVDSHYSATPTAAQKKRIAQFCLTRTQWIKLWYYDLSTFSFFILSPPHTHRHKHVVCRPCRQTRLTLISPLYVKPFPLLNPLSSLPISPSPPHPPLSRRLMLSLI